MHAEFWHRRWARSEIGFHQREVNADLVQHWPALQLYSGDQVFVPLCGKSLDMVWLSAQGLQVLGIELSQVAVEDFFKEQGLQPEVTEAGAFRCYEAERLRIFCGDFFALTAEHVEACRGIYDRAALIALPPEMRARYVAHLSQIMPRGCQSLLVTLDYPQEQMSGPPFAVSDEEVQRLFSPDWDVERLQQLDVLGGNWRFLEKGLSRLEENVYRLIRA
ncbi:thiopurine S-methyltransferase [Ectopseudomonas mendocina]|uniref:Thiopurine S-methyltransferase n=1 Tax=Ectopseudomonas mendocina TaxID=300 RepID=A0ABZ2RCQ9_ECTME